METYRVGVQRSTNRDTTVWFRHFLLTLVTYVVAGVMHATFWPSLGSESIARRILSGAVWAAAFTWTISKFGYGLGSYYDLVVSENEITAQYAVAFKTVHKGRVRTILERGRWLSNRPGMVASERGKLGAWFWGGVFIPRDLPDYDRPGETVLSWRA